MRRSHITIAIAILLLVARPAAAQTDPSVPPPPAPGQVPAPDLEGPTTELEPIPIDNGAKENRVVRDAEPGEISHDALAERAPRGRGERVHAPKPPPQAIVERPSGARPQSRAEWVPGYWDWDPARSEFFWMGGVWRVPPQGTIWVGSRWLRDQDGWYRAAGFWSQRRDRVAVATSYDEVVEPAWRKTGPSADRPVDPPTAAPGPDYFYVPGHYAPEGANVTWKPGFWARSQPTWDWVPARWVRRAGGWEFRAGHWVREPDAVDARVALRPGVGSTADDAPVPPGGSEVETDPIAEAEAGITVRRRGRPVVIVPRVGRPYYHVIRPPGLFPYGPGGVIVPDAVPPFVRNILDQVLP